MSTALTPLFTARTYTKAAGIAAVIGFMFFGDKAHATGGAAVLSAKGVLSSEGQASGPTQTMFEPKGVLPSGLDVSSGLSLNLAQRWQSDKSIPEGHSGSVYNPVSPFAYTRISSDFGMRKDPLLGTWRKHQGIDLPGVKGTPIYAANDGWVAYSGYASGYGLLVRIEHGPQVESLYGHLSGVAVAANRHIFRGALIGYLGSTGRSTGAHLHFEIRQRGRAIDPLAYLATSAGRTQVIPQALVPQPAHVSDHAKQRAKQIEASADLPGSR